MKLTSHLEKWASGLLGVVCLVLLINLVMSFNDVRAGSSRPSTPVARAPENRRARADAPRSADELSRHDAELRLDLLKEIQSRPLVQIARNPFQYETPRPRMTNSDLPSLPTAVAPPAPPPNPLKALGYSEKPGGVREAYLTDDEEIYVVHEGDTVVKRFKVLKIKPNVIEVQDDLTHQAVELPIPQ